MSEFPDLDSWLNGWIKTREEDRLVAKRFPSFKEYVKFDTKMINKTKRTISRLEKKYSK